MGIEDRELVGLLFARARELAGSEEDLASLVAEWTGRTYRRQAINAWIQNRTNPPAFLLFSLARHYALSLDEFMLGTKERRTLQEQLSETNGQLDEARRNLAILQAEMDRLRSARGEPPLEYPRATGTA